jgi:hypothetical protein
MNISRDERHGRLHCRYRCVSNDFFLLLRVHWAVSRSHSGFDWHQPRNETGSLRSSD